MEDVETANSLTGKRYQLVLPLSCDPPGPNNLPKQRVWIIFGGTGHMGRSVVKIALSKGDLVTMVGRSLMDNPDSMHRGIVAVGEASGATKVKGSASTSAQSSHAPGHERSSNLLCLVCDVRVRTSVAAALFDHFQHWGDGRLDIIANCSTYGVFGACEDQDDAELRNQVETNFWGTLHIVQLSLPYLRASGGGRYLIFSSTSGALGVPGLGPYCATKYAVEGLVESMLYEVDAFDIKATLVSPGHVRRDEPEGIEERRSSKQEPDGNRPDGSLQSPGTVARTYQLPAYSSFIIKTPSVPYSNPSNPAFHAKRVVQWIENSQPTSVVKAAELVWQLAHCSYPPLRLLLGSFAVESVRDRLRTIMEEIEDWKFLSFGEEIDLDKARDRICGKEPSRPNSEDEEDIFAQQQASAGFDGKQDDAFDFANLEDEEFSDMEDKNDPSAMEED